MAVVSYGSNVAEWYKKSSKIKTLSNVQVWQLSQATTEAVAALCQRTMQLQLNILDGEWNLISDHGQALIEWTQIQ